MSYEKFVTNYRRYTHAPRTYDEAYKTATYATAMWKCRTENQRGVEHLLEKVVGLTFLFVFGFAVAGFTIWLTRT
jgi:hypothetical protein